MKKLSVIIPAYNAHSTLPAALASIVMQNMVDDIIVYVVDDHSIETYDQIIGAFKPLVEIVLIRLDNNEGPALARQVAFDEVKTPYITCLDADDVFVGQTHLKYMIEQLEANNADLICGEFEEFVLNGTTILHKNDDVWFFGKIYKKELIDKHNMRIPIVPQNEDTAFNALYHIYCTTILYYDKVVYNWNYQPNSITRKNNSEYAVKSYEGLIENLIAVYGMIDTAVVPKEKILHHLANRMIRLYGLGLTYYQIGKEEVLVGYLSKLRRFYDVVLKQYADKITNEIYAYEWGFVPVQEYPIFGFREFLKSLETGQISI